MQGARYHREQLRGNYCVPACTAMILARLGRPQDQEEICRDWTGSRRGFPPVNAAVPIGAERVITMLDDPRLLVELRRLLEGPRWIIAGMFCERMEGIIARMEPRPISRFGAMTGVNHAIVLTDYVERGFRYLDPFFGSAGQPFEMAEDDFVFAYASPLVVSPVLPPEVVLAEQDLGTADG